MIVQAKYKRAMGIFSEHIIAEMVLSGLRDSNFPMDKVSLINIVSSLIGLDIVEDLAKKYDCPISQGDYLIMLEGSDDNIKTAQNIFRYLRIKHWEISDDNRDPHSYQLNV
ncbi:hypothetical protein [Pseudanabaena mucicola]|uniref:Uncharacterized protein n=1 Tax=Pseudanabaena mucicola FACHB-723 TaxID=2692860 RepID=A0ABR7ZXB8_9CYAN|nr:hypothetical protein [Pseudanabaena mucicola]MBD2188467.1 hypothetical protein [Pseudanabaena mucicola FACHB-723]